MTAPPRPAPHAAPQPVSSAAVERELARLRLHAPTTLNTPGSHRAFFRWVLGLALAGVLGLFLPWQQSVQGTGVVTALRPQDRPQTLPAAIDGQLQGWYVREGQFVRRGQLIARLSEVKEEYLDPDVVARTAEQRDAKAAGNVQKRRAAASLGEQAEALARGRTLKLAQTRNKIAEYEAAVAAARADSAFAAGQLERRRAVFDSGLVSLNDFQGTQLKAQKAAAELAEKRAGLANARVDLAAVDAEYGKEIVKAQAERAKTLADASDGAAEVAKLATKVAALRVRRGFYEVRAPQDGYVVQAQRMGLGETVKAGDPVVTVQPAAPEQAVELYVTGNDVPLVRLGDRVRLQFDGWPALQFAGWPSVSVGTFGGRVAVVDRVSSRAGQFRMLVTADTTGGDQPWPAQVRMGSGVYGWAMLREVRVWFELWRRMNGFPPSVAAPPAAPAGKGGAKA